jgi:hypothetical protein
MSTSLLLQNIHKIIVRNFLKTTADAQLRLRSLKVVMFKMITRVYY